MKYNDKIQEQIRRRQARQQAQNRFTYLLTEQQIDNIQRQENNKNVEKIMKSNDIDFKKLMIKNGVKKS
tara:strand:- start:149 stop:355 length:207 start_codon:yes stop_codon:yes gene_type:complete